RLGPREKKTGKVCRFSRKRGVELGSSTNSLARRREATMLFMRRKLGEKIYINDNICITVVDIDRGKIRLGIEAPRNVPIFRQELLPLNNPRPETPEPATAQQGVVG